MAFQHAHHFTIDTFNAHNTVIQATAPTTDPIAILQAARTIEATHTSKTAAYAPKCKPGTRAKIIQHIVDFAVAGGSRVATGVNNTGAGSGSMLWFQGPAGSGKTCIMREVASRLSSAGLLAATYFFSVRLAGLSEEGPFIATIAHQILSTIPHLRPTILKAVEDNLTVFSESLETQLEQLIVKPFAAKVLEDGSGRKYVILVDGFDECVITERGHLLQVLHALAISTPSLLIIIASRPELDIRTAFNRPDYKVITHFLRLQDYDGTSDIRNYLCDEFCRIRDNHPARASIPESWPAEQVLSTLVNKSSGNFIVASTVIKYVDNPRRNPVAVLETVMALFTSYSTSALDTNPLAPLDALYTLILHPPEGDVALIKRILHCHIAVRDERDVVKSAAFFDRLLDQPPGTTDMALCDLHSVLFFPDPKRRYGVAGIVFHHATLRDFLTSELRSADLFESHCATHLDVASLCARRLEAWALDPSKLESSSVEHYAGTNWMHHFSLGLGWEGSNIDPGPLPPTLLQFDARLSWKYQFLSSFQKGDSFDPPSSGLHTTVERLKSLVSR